MSTAIFIPEREGQITRWFSEYSNRLLRFVRSKVNDFAEAEDIAQDVWYQLTLQEDIAHIEQIGGWLFAAAKNKVVNFYKKKKNVPFSDLTVLENEEEPMFLDQWVSDNVTDEAATSKEFQLMLEKALESLPTEQREVFMAHEIEGISFKEWSEKTGIPVNTLLARKRYAVLKLREIFKSRNI